MRTTFNIGFVCRPSKANKLGLAPVELTIIINGSRAYLTLQRKENPSKFKKLIAQSKQNDLKTYLNLVVDKINEAQLELLRKGIPVTVEELREFIKNGCTSSYKVSNLFSDYLILLRNRIGVDLTYPVYRKYEIVRDLFLSFTGDVELSSITPSIITSFYIHLNKQYLPTTSAGMMTKLKTVMLYAFNNALIKHNPFSTTKIVKRVKEVEFLTEKEIQVIKKKNLISRLDKVRDLFLFQCFTGLSYVDMSLLTKDDFKVNEYNQIFIHKERVKTGVSFTTVLLEDAVRIIKKYDYQLPVISNQKYNGYLKEIQDICCIKKSLHSHIGRHTAATYLLNKGIPLETVSKILGHSNIKQTQHYAKLVDKSVFAAINKIS